MERVVPAHEGAPTGQAEAPAARGLALPRSDELLARLVASGSERAFRALYERYQAPLYRYCYSLVRNEADAQDALQSTFTRALMALRESRRNAPLRPWLYRIAHNESISLLRARPPVVADKEPEPLVVEPSAEERASERARLGLLLADLTQLAERPRAALVMRELSGLSHGEIAAALGVSVGAAKQAIFEARSALFELSEGRAMACDDVRQKLSDGDRRVLRGRQVRAHLRDCESCSAFAAAVPARQAELRALVPALPPAAASVLLARVLEGAAGHGGRAAAGASAGAGGSTVAGTGSGVGSAGAGASSTAASAAKVIAAIATPKALLTTAVIAGVAAGGGGLLSGTAAHHAASGSQSGAPPLVRSLGHAGADHPAVSGARHSSAAAGPAVGPARVHARPGAPSNAPTKSHHPGNGPSSPGNSGNAPGHQPGAAPGNSGSAPGHQPGATPGNSATAPGHSPGSTPGNSANAPGHTKTAPGKSNTSTSRTGVPPGLARHDHTPPGQNKAHGNPHLG